MNLSRSRLTNLSPLCLPCPVASEGFYDPLSEPHGAAPVSRCPPYSSEDRIVVLLLTAVVMM